VKEITNLREFHPKTILLWLFLWKAVSEAAKQAKREIAYCRISLWNRILWNRWFYFQEI